MHGRRLTTGLVALTLAAGAVLTVASAEPAGAATYTVSRAKAIEIPDAGAADPFPSSITANGLGTSISDVNVTLAGLTDAKPTDLDIEVVGPDGTAVALMSDACGQSALHQAGLTFDDSAPGPMPDGRGCGSASYQPTNLGGGADTWAVTPTATSLSAFAGRNPNGVWRLYVRDDNDGGGTGVIADGWSLTLTTDGAPTISIPGSTMTDGDGTAAPYPFAIQVGGKTKVTLNVDVTLPGLTHPAPGTLQVLLVSPAGTGVLLLSSTCGRTPLADVTLTFDDAAAQQMSPALGTCASGTYKPSAQDVLPTALPAPAPAGPYATRLSAFKGQNPNGTWYLYVLDTAKHDVGYVAGAPTLNVRTDTRPPNTTFTKKPKSSYRAKTKLRFTSNEAGSRFQCRLDRRRWHACRSPLRLRHLRAGKHTFKARAIDPAGNRDRTAAVVTWTVKHR